MMTFTPHPRLQVIRERHAKRRLFTPPPGWVSRFNAYLAVQITNSVGTMWCAYVFAALACISLPEAINAGTAQLVAWIAQTFLQLVLLSIIIVGQKVEGAVSEARAIETYKDAEALLTETAAIKTHLEAQDETLARILYSQERKHEVIL